MYMEHFSGKKKMKTIKDYVYTREIHVREI